MNLREKDKWFIISHAEALTNFADISMSLTTKLDSLRDEQSQLKLIKKAKVNGQISKYDYESAFNGLKIGDSSTIEASKIVSNAIKEKNRYKNEYRQIIQTLLSMYDRDKDTLEAIMDGNTYPSSLHDGRGRTLIDFALTENEKKKIDEELVTRLLFMSLELIPILEDEARSANDSANNAVFFADDTREWMLSINSDESITDKDILDFTNELRSGSHSRAVADLPKFIRNNMRKATIHSDVLASHVYGVTETTTRDEFLRDSGLTVYLSIREAIVVANREIDKLLSRNSTGVDFIDDLVSEQLSALKEGISLLKKHPAYTDQNRSRLIEASTLWRECKNEIKSMKAMKLKHEKELHQLSHDHFIFKDIELSSVVAKVYGARFVGWDNMSHIEKATSLLRELHKMSDEDIIVIGAEVMNCLHANNDFLFKSTFTLKDFRMAAFKLGVTNDTVSRVSMRDSPITLPSELKFN